MLPIEVRGSLVSSLPNDESCRSPVRLRWHYPRTAASYSLTRPDSTLQDPTAFTRLPDRADRGAGAQRHRCETTTGRPGDHAAGKHRRPVALRPEGLSAVVASLGLGGWGGRGDMVGPGVPCGWIASHHRHLWWRAAALQMGGCPVLQKEHRVCTALRRRSQGTRSNNDGNGADREHGATL